MIALLESATATVAVSADGRIVAHSNTGLPNNANGNVTVNRWNVATSEWEAMGGVLSGNDEYDGFGESVALSASGMAIAVGAAESESVEIAGEVDPAGGVRARL